LSGYPGSHRDLRPLGLGGDLGSHPGARLLLSHARCRASPKSEVPGEGQHGQRVEEHRRQQEMIAEPSEPKGDRRHKPHSLSSGDEGTSIAASAAAAPGAVVGPADASSWAVGDVPAGVVPGGTLPCGPRSPGAVAPGEPLPSGPRSPAGAAPTVA